MTRRYLSSLTRIFTLSLVLVMAGACGGMPSNDIADLTREVLTPTQAIIPNEKTTSPHEPVNAATLNPPFLISHQPLKGEVIAPDTPIILTFSKEMDMGSVERALHIVPDTGGVVTYVWDDAMSLRIIPGPEELLKATRYRLHLDALARDNNGVQLTRDYSFVFATVSDLKVTQTYPAAGETVSRADFPLRVSFNQPVVTSECVASGSTIMTECPSNIVKFTPAILGTGRWVHETIYEFTPYDNWNAGGTYRLSLLPDMVSVAGVGFLAPPEWDFNISAPVISAVSPAPDALDVELASVIHIWFSTPMDAIATGRELQVQSENGDVISGVISWLDNDAHMLFTPVNPLALGITYVVQVGEHARAQSSTPLVNPSTWRFSSIPYPRVVSLISSDDTFELEFDEPIRVLFAGDIDYSTLDRGVTITPLLQSQQVYFDRSTVTLVISGNRRPGQNYCITVSDDVTDIYGNNIQEPVTECFTGGDFPEDFSIANGERMHTLSVNVPSVLSFRNLNTNSVDFALYELDHIQFLRRDLSRATLIRQWNETFSEQKNTTEVVSVPLRRLQGALPAGFYAVTWSVETNDVEEAFIAIVDRNVVIKLSVDEVIAWVTDISSGVPISRTAVSFFSPSGDLVAGGTTDDDGLVRIPILSRNTVWETVTAIVGAPGTEGFGLAQSHWYGQASPDVFDVELSWEPYIAYQALLWTEHNAYMPGQSVYYYGYLLQRDDNTYSLTQNRPVLNVRLIDKWHNSIFDSQTAVMPSGMFEGFLPLDDLLPTGMYTISLILNDTDVSLDSKASFTVSQKDRNKYDFAVYSNSSSAFVGDTLQFFVSAVDSSGNVMADTPFNWQIISEPDYPFSGGNSITDFTSQYTWNNTANAQVTTMVTTGVGTTDTFGEATIIIPTHSSQPFFGSSMPEEQLWGIHIQYENHNVVTEMGGSLVHVRQSNYRLGIQLKSRVIESGERVNFDLIVLRDEWDPAVSERVVVTLSEKSAFPNNPLDAPLPVEVIPDKIVEVTTDEQGKASGFFTIKASGKHIVTAALIDKQDHTLTVKDSIWVSSVEEITTSTNAQYLYPIADRHAYNVGDVARVLLPISHTGPYLLFVTLEREQILYTDIISVDSANPIIEIPILDTYAPNVYAAFTSILQVDDGRTTTQSGYVELSVYPPNDQLHIQVSTDQDHYAPGDQAYVRIRITDSEALPVDADVFVSVQEMGEATPSFAHATHDFLAGPKPLQVASGNSLLMSGAELAGFDYGSDITLPSTLMGERGILKQILLEPILPNTLFVRLVKQQATNGEILFTVDVPDSHKSWQINVGAVNQDSHFGIGQGEIMVSSTLSIQAVLPEMYVVEDQSEINAILRNQTATRQKITIEFESIEGINLTSNNRIQMIEFPPFAQRQISWTVGIPYGNSQTARFQILLSGDDYQYVYNPGGKTGIPISYFYTHENLNTASGIIFDDNSVVDIVPVTESVLSNTTLSVYMESQIAAAFSAGLDYVLSYPVNTSDVIVDRVFTSIIYEKLFTNEIGIKDGADIHAQSSITQSLDILYARQNNDGGWGWWRGASNLQLTAYVALGILRSKEAGYPIQASNSQYGSLVGTPFLLNTYLCSSCPTIVSIVAVDLG